MLDLSDRRFNSLARPAQMPFMTAAASLSVSPDAAKIAFRARPSAIDAASHAFGIELPQTACSFHARDNRAALWLGPDEWMLTATNENPASLFTEMHKAVSGQPCSLVDVSHRSDAFDISGLKSEYVLNHGCPLDLSRAAFPVGMCTRTIIGKASVVLSRVAETTFHIDVWRSFSPYVWRFLDEARSELT